MNTHFSPHRFAVHSVLLGTLAQVYTRDATHRPTATSTPGRGAFLSLCRETGGFGGFRDFLELLFEEIPGISRNLTNFPKFSKKSEKK